MSETTTAAAKATVPAKAMDPALLARLTGALGDSAKIEKICSNFGRLYAEFLPDIFHSETGFTLEVHYSGHETGLMTDLVAGLGENYVLADATLRNWCPVFVIACGNGFIITLMENMLGALSETIEQPIERPLSSIELDLSTMVFERIGDVLHSGINAAGGFEPVIEKACNAEHRPPHDPDVPDQYAATIKMEITLGNVTSEFALIVPQKALLKTVVTLPKSKGGSARSKEWSDNIAEQVRRSQVTLEARIRLQSLTLGTISRLAPGDVIAFDERGDVTVDVSANGKELYKCEFGRSGEKYTVRVKDNVTTDDEILRHLLG
ncbi:FliM/FliN family flagellar motor switch protein [Rhizobium halophytocola]|uniref:Flagellar motor switch protein FliM n=1 Tax=Rhizobium halophytocola TaxID=735519 RepID=A0ABS4E580_9HYPH|nr:FliM/FliN family flagellar motor switch protein [Rhizobium halophytocola]MBP1853109.1 flagellar motor switch protein FliM [Rhizobium halophytocola]